MNSDNASASVIDGIWTTPKSIEDYRRKTEFVVVWTQVAVVSVLLALYILAPTPQDAMNPLLYGAILGGYSAWLVVLVIVTHIGPQPKFLIWGSIVVDFVALFALVWAIHLHYNQPPAFYLKAPTNYYVFIFIALRVIRFEPQYVLGSGIIAAAGWAVLAVFVQSSQGEDVVTGNYTTYMMENRLLWGAEIDKCIVVLIVTVLLAITADRARVLLMHQISIAADLEQKSDSLEKASLIDTFTGLPNRHAAPDILGDVCSRTTGPVGVLIIRIGDLGRTLTVFGPKFAEDLITSVRDGLVEFRLADDQLLRLDDDSFLLLTASSVNSDALSSRAQMLLQSFKEPLEIGDRRVPVHLRIGICTADESEDPNDVLRRTRAAVYSIKREQSPPIAFFNDAMVSANERFAEIEHEMRMALDDQTGFEPHYQAIVKIETGEITGFEALARWRLPNGEMISPGEFVPVAEATGMIVPLGRLIFQRAVEDLVRFNSGRPEHEQLFMGINVSIRQLQDPKFVKRVEAILEGIDSPPELIKVEVTESLEADSGDDCRNKLQALRDKGLKIAVDDFGTGYSSLSYLQSMPFTSLKIDQSFIRGMEEGKNRTALVKSIVDIAKAFRMESIAEGIEDDDALAFVKKMGVDLGQGYLFARPCPFDEAYALVSKPEETA